MRLLRDIAVLLILIALQVLVFNNFLFFSYLNPYLYVYWILSRNHKDQRALFLILGFALGAAIDIFEGSGGMHALATVSIAYFQPYLWRLFHNGSDENEEAPWMMQLSLERRLPFLFTALLLHHFILFTAESFGFSNVGILIQRSIFSSLFSFTFVALYQIWKARR